MDICSSSLFFWIFLIVFCMFVFMSDLYAARVLDNMPKIIEYFLKFLLLINALQEGSRTLCFIDLAHWWLQVGHEFLAWVWDQVKSAEFGFSVGWGTHKNVRFMLMRGSDEFHSHFPKYLKENPAIVTASQESYFCQRTKNKESEDDDDSRQEKKLIY